MEIVLITLGVIFAFVFGARFIWFLIEFVGGLMWNISGVFIFWAVAIFSLMFYANLVSH